MSKTLPRSLPALVALSLACGPFAPPSTEGPAPGSPVASPGATAPPSAAATASPPPFEESPPPSPPPEPPEEPPLVCPAGTELQAGPWLVPSFAAEPAGTTGAPSDLTPALPARSEGDQSWWCVRGGVGDGPALQIEDSGMYPLQVRGAYVAGKRDGTWRAQWDLGEDYWSDAFALEFSLGQPQGDWVLYCTAPSCEGEITRQRYVAGQRDGTWVWGGGRTSVRYVGGRLDAR